MNPDRFDQAQGLRALFDGAGQRHLAVVANPFVEDSGVAIERLTAALAVLGQRMLVIDAAESSPDAPEGVALELASGVEMLSPDLAYLPARGLPMRYVNTRGSSARLVEEASAAVPGTEVVLVHASASDLARLFTHRSVRPLLLAGDDPDSIKHAYAAWKQLTQRCGWFSADLLLVAPEASPRLDCADRFIQAALTGWAAVDPATPPSELPHAALKRLVAAQLVANGESAHLDTGLPAGLRRAGQPLLPETIATGAF